MIGGDVFHSEVRARREWEVEEIKEKLDRHEVVDLPLCRLERVAGAHPPTARFGLKRGKLVYVFKFDTHDVERDKHRNVISRARFIKTHLEHAGYRLIPWDFKKGQPPRFWLHDHPQEQHQIDDAAMDEEDDDLYGPSETTATTTTAEPAAASTSTEVKPDPVRDGDESEGDEPMDEGLESGEETDESDDSDDLEIIIDRPPDAPKPNLSQQQPPRNGTPSDSRAIKIEAPPQSQPQQPSTSTPSNAPTGTKPTAPSHNGQPGSSFPAIKSSSPALTQALSNSANPTYPPVGKPILAVDMDADLAEHTKPWRLPGADQSDYFNYGFDEFTWEMYRQRQDVMAGTLSQQKAETAQLQSFFDPRMMGGAPPGPGANPGNAPPTGPSSGTPTGGNGVPPNAPTGPSGGGNPAAVGGPGGPGAGMPGAGMPGMPSDEMMQQMMQQMMSQGMDPSSMDFGTFAQMFGSGGFPGGVDPQQQQQQQAGGYAPGPAGRGGARRGGRGRGW